MFKMQLSGSDQENKDQPNQKIENFPVHTMRKDLADLENPKPEIFRSQTDTVKNFATPRPQNLTSIQKTSPFLGSNLPKPAAPVPATPRPMFSPAPAKPTMPITAAPKPQITKITSAFPEKELAERPAGIGKSLVIIFAVLILAIIAGGGYYFWMTRQSADELATDIPAADVEDMSAIGTPEDSATEPEPVAPPEEESEFSTTLPNYLPLDFNDTKENISAKIFTDYAGKVAQSALTIPIEFIITDQENNPVNFQVFANKLGIIFPPSVLTQLGNNFSLFIYSIGNNEARLGLAIDTLSAGSLKTALQTNEATLISTLDPLIGIAYNQSSISPAFQTSTYSGTEIRYKNITGPETLSLDYTIYNNQLLIGTTKTTLRSIIDRKKETPAENPSASSDTDNNDDFDQLPDTNN